MTGHRKCNAYRCVAFFKIERIDTPDVHSIVQRDREVFTQLVEGSDMPCFTTDAPQNGNHVEGRAEVPISDASAHATFYLVALTGAPARVHEIVDWVNSTT